ncbi:hypothetical protein H4Q26_004282 [Puccinia striiformis f. sp. tritici PST-130]|uniref:Uncharacterized protein n=1 Tax=Puccinia striiformis f. sp. tritici PST-78 TaxID=1165861 RepID=A0A0L0V520_9BASI|nr:hypothetical protein H4Q26_004282 [Puccinia striiformis f. sp. tritici PST-130]KNE94373.1 hypothetical protein PSTG_12273 [Puccinia striiformis f. sp. tritici PST-78]
MPSDDEILASMNKEDLDVDVVSEEENEQEDSNEEVERVPWNLTQMRTALNEIEFVFSANQPTSFKKPGRLTLIHFDR